MSRFAFQPLPRQPLVSVLMTSYNYARFLSEALASVYAQTYRHLELVVVDDGSTDGSQKLIERAAEVAPFRTECIFQNNGGQATAWNTAFPKLKGDLVCFIDSDDTWRADKVERMVALAQERPEAGLYQHQLDNGADKLKLAKLRSRDILRDWVALERVDVITRRDLVAIFLPSSGLMARREVLERVFPIPRQLITCPDAYLTRMCCVYGPLISNPTVLGSWREHEQNAGKTSRFSFGNYWLPTVMPAINAGFEKHDAPVQFCCAPPTPTSRLLRSVRALFRKG